MNKYKTLQEQAKAKGKQLLIESVSYSPKAEDVIVFTSKDNKFTEAKSGKQFEARGILKNVPITRYTENANGRVYSKELWEAVHKSGMFEGSDALANHSDDDGDVLDQVGVWHNFQVGEEVSTADLYCIGAAGNLLLEKIKAGGKTGFSTVGFGELNEDGPLAGKEVNPSSYEYSQTDWVMKPSQGVFATQENLEEKSIVQKENKISESIITNKVEEKIKMVEVKGKMDKYLELSIKNQIKATIKEAIANENCVEAIKGLKEVSETIIPEMAEQKAQVEATIVQIQNTLEEQKNNAKQELKESKETLESLSKKYEASCETIKVLKENLDKASKIVEKANDKDIVKSVKMMEADLKQFSEDRELMEADIKVLVEEVQKRDSDLKVYEEDTELREKDIAKFKEEREKMKLKSSTKSKALKVAEKHIKELEKILKEDFDYDFDDEIMDDEDDLSGADIDGGLFDDDVENDEYIFEADEDGKEDEEKDDEDDKEEAKKESKKSKSKKRKEAEEDDSEDSDEDEEEMEESDDEDEDDEEEKMDESDDEDEDDEELDEAEEDDKEDDEKEDDSEDNADDKMAAVRAAKKEAIRRKKRQEAKRLQAKVDAKKKSVKESKAPVKEVVAYYKAIVEAKPSIRDIKEAVLKSGSIAEAIKKVTLFETKFGNDIHKLKESRKEQSSQFTNYKFKI